MKGKSWVINKVSLGRILVIICYECMDGKSVRSLFRTGKTNGVR